MIYKLILDKIIKFSYLLLYTFLIFSCAPVDKYSDERGELRNNLNSQPRQDPTNYYYQQPQVPNSYQQRQPYYYQQQQQQYAPQNYGVPASRYYSNPYAIPPSNSYQRYDADQYYVPPNYYQNIESPQQQIPSSFDSPVR
jgi:hypothetical protein